MKTTEISLPDLQTRVHTALKSWHDMEVETNPFADLQLFQQTQLAGTDGVRETINSILLEALETLAVKHDREAELLRKYFLNGMVMHAVANSLNMGEATAYRKRKVALKQLTQIIHAREQQVRAELQRKFEQRLDPPTYDQLIGFDRHLDHLLEVLTSPGSPWLISIEGLGGLGKTSLADALARHLIRRGQFYDFGWVSARSYIFNPGGGIKAAAHPALTAADLVEKLVTQLMPDRFRSPPFVFEDMLENLRTRLNEQPHLIVIDNLETVTDLEILLPTLRYLVNPTKFLLTSRESLHYEPGLYHFELPALSQLDACRLIRHEAQLHNLPELVEADDSILHRVYKIVGGNPLALRLVVGQVHTHALDVVLDDLAAARGQKAELLYTFIYRRAWDHLDEAAQAILLAMPLVADHGGSLAFLADLTRLDLATLRDGLSRLVALNLVYSNQSLSDRRYTIHNLTRTFLQEQVARWQ